jgi:peroxiredoxin
VAQDDLWARLPVPADDGACDHLPGAAVPALSLPSTTGASVDLAGASANTAVFYVYPRTGREGVEPPPEWDAIPGARGCTPQSCAFRDHYADITALGADVFGISAQATEEQREFAERVGLPYPLLSDPGLALAGALRLPTFGFRGARLYKRVTFIAIGGRIEKVFYPVFPPDRNAADVVAWLGAAGS